MSELSDLFDADPLGHSDKDTDTIITGFRDMRHKFNLGDLRAGSVKTTAKKPTAISAVSASELEELLNLPIKL